MEVPSRIVLDTSILVDILRGTGNDPTRLLESALQIATTTISAFELYYGAHKSNSVSRNLASAKGLLASLQILNLSQESCETAGRILADLESAGRPIDPKDLFIGSIALTEGYAVLTKNSEHFKRIPDLMVLEPKNIMHELRGIDNAHEKALREGIRELNEEHRKKANQ